jgi:hypothetical protein
METWRKVWREGFAPEMSDAALVALRIGLSDDDDRLVQGATCVPPPLACVQDWPCEGACGIGYAGWKSGPNCERVRDVEEYFARLCFRADKRIGEPAGCRWFLNWFDDTPREEMRQTLIGEIDWVLANRMPPFPTPEEVDAAFDRTEVAF